MKIKTAILFLALSLTMGATAQNTEAHPDRNGMNLTAQEWNKAVVIGWNLGYALKGIREGAGM